MNKPIWVVEYQEEWPPASRGWISIPKLDGSILAATSRRVARELQKQDKEDLPGYYTRIRKYWREEE